MGQVTDSVENESDILTDDLLSKDEDDEKSKVKYGMMGSAETKKKKAKRVFLKLRQRFTCDECDESWTTKFKGSPVQECKKCGNEGIKGEVTVPEGYHFVGTIECTTCKNNWTRPIKPSKIGNFRCIMCRKKSTTIIEFGVSEGSFEDEFEKYMMIEQTGDYNPTKIVGDEDSGEEKEEEEEEEEVVHDGYDELKSSFEEEANICQKCKENTMGITLIPCGDTLCKECYENAESKKGRKCPICQIQIHSCVKMFLDF